MKTPADATRKDLRNFGLLMTAALGLIALLLLYKGDWRPGWAVWILAGLAVAFLFFGLLLPAALKPLFILWMGLARVLNWVMTRVILLIFFSLILFPMGAVMRLFGYDPLRTRAKRDQARSYWIAREPDPRGNKHFENPF